MPKMAVIDLVTGEVRGVIVASPGDPPHRGTKLVLIPPHIRKPLVDARFTWNETDGFQPKPEYLAKVKRDREGHPSWRAKMRVRYFGKEAEINWNAAELRFETKERG